MGAGPCNVAVGIPRQYPPEVLMPCVVLAMRAVGEPFAHKPFALSRDPSAHELMGRASRSHPAGLKTTASAASAGRRPSRIASDRRGARQELLQRLVCSCVMPARPASNPAIEASSSRISQCSPPRLNSTCARSTGGWAQLPRKPCEAYAERPPVGQFDRHRAFVKADACCRNGHGIEFSPDGAALRL